MSRILPLVLIVALPLTARADDLKDILDRLNPALEPLDTGPWLERCNLRQTHLERLSITAGDVTAQLENVHVTLDGTPILHGVNLPPDTIEMVYYRNAERLLSLPPV